MTPAKKSEPADRERSEPADRRGSGRVSEPRGQGPLEQTLSPSDVASGAHRERILGIGGRIVSIDGAKVVVGDALGQMRVTLRDRALPVPPLSVGELVVVRGVRSGRSLVDALVVSRAAGHPPCSAGRADGLEGARFTVGGTGRRLAARSRALKELRTYFDARSFVEVETPVRVPSPGLDAHVDAIPAQGGFLITSPELHMKRLVVGGLPRIYQLARVSRAEELGALHEPEFTMLEWYRAFADVEAVIRDTESLVVDVVRLLTGGTSVHLGGRVVDVSPPFDRVTVREAFRRHAGIDDAAALAERDPDRYFQIFVDAVEPALAAHPRALLLTEFPLSQAALARPCSHDPAVAERFEAYVAGVELCNGFGELNDAQEQRQRFELELDRRRRTGAPLQPIDERFLSALEEGLPPCAGNALGVDRLVMLALGSPCIEDVTAFPARWA